MRLEARHHDLRRTNAEGDERGANEDVNHAYRCVDVSREIGEKDSRGALVVRHLGPIVEERNANAGARIEPFARALCEESRALDIQISPHTRLQHGGRQPSDVNLELCALVCLQG